MIEKGANLVAALSILMDLNENFYRRITTFGLTLTSVMLTTHVFHYFNIYYKKNDNNTHNKIIMYFMNYDK